MVTKEHRNEIEQTSSEIKFIINAINSSRQIDAETQQLLSIISRLIERLNEQNREQIELLTAFESRLSALENRTSGSFDRQSIE